MKQAYLKWYKERQCRRVMMTTGVLAFLFILFSWFHQIVMIFAVLFAGVTIFCSICDTYLSRKQFKQDVIKVEQEHKIREIETFGDVTSEAFNEQDKKEIKRKTRNFTGIIALKIIFMLILVALLFQVGI